uniref:RNA-dependent RNA polymerase n=1 Tax=Colletotrichum higginsianum mitovirus 1 TaxID=2824786 RepID=A0A8B0R9J0_9VIRU|nr:RNA-dependent RNA polymerase [Colletotrichum higginsianum mitovirus 1]
MKKNNIKFKKLNLVSFKDRVIKSIKTFTIGNHIPDSLSVPLRQIMYLSFGRIRDLTTRATVTANFLKLILKLNKNHGSDFTIKWLKACYVALQKALGDDRLKSLRDLEPGLPLPRLINGFPAIIGSRDRDLIRKGDSRVTIYWSSLFSIYRVLKCSYKLKTSSITDPFSGSTEWFRSLIELPHFRVYFHYLDGFDALVKKSNLAPKKINLLRSASSTNTVSWHGLITDAVLWLSDEKMFSIYEKYLTSIFETKVKDLSLIGMRLNELDALKVKKSLTGEFGQFSLKEEAAGKLRIFAIVDSITQNMLAPLHSFMFSVLRLIPNDGTFDQEASIRRSQEKSVIAGKAYSFDLSAATDRLPVDLSVKILSKIFSDNFAEAWKSIMTDRDFYFSQSAIKTYDAPEKLRYSVGQPMGALSSWPALALTHHWILQYCSSLLGRTKWEDQYEILGDDLVVFDSDLAGKYLEIATLLGIEINLNKSISSPCKPVFEFAKRTCVGNTNVSPIPVKQLLSNSKLSERCMNFITFLERGLLNKRSLMGVALSKFGSWRIINNNDEIKTPLLAILGILHSKNVIPHRWLVEALINPKMDIENGKDFSIPREGVIKLIKEYGESLSKEKLTYPYSHEEDRKEVYLDYEPEFSNIIANTSYTIAKRLERDLPKLISEEAKNLYLPFDHMKDPTLASAIEGFFDDLLYRDGMFDVGELVDSIETNKKFYYRRLDIEEALKIERSVEDFTFNYELTPKAFNSVEVDSAPVLKVISKLLGNHSSGYLSIERPS